MILFTVGGKEKSLALKAVLEGPYEPEQLPSQLLQPTDGKLLWLVDAGRRQLCFLMEFENKQETQWHTSSTGKIETYLGAKAESLLGFKSPKISKDRLHLPGPDFIDRVWSVSNRNIRVLTNLQRMFGHGRLRQHRLSLDSPGRPGHRAFRRRQLREKSRLFRRAKISSSSPWKATATPSPPLSASSAPSPANTRTKFPSS